MEEISLKVLVVGDLTSKAEFARAAIAKGVDEKGLIVDSIVKDIAWTGDSRVILKSDNEPAIAKVLEESLKAAGVGSKWHKPALTA